MRKTMGQEIVIGLRELNEALKSGRPLEEQFTCSRVTLNLKPGVYNARRVRDTRQSLGMSQALFAQFLGVSSQSVRAWEQGKNVPSDIAKRFMDELRLAPEYWRARVAESLSAKPAKRERRQAAPTGS